MNVWDDLAATIAEVGRSLADWAAPLALLAGVPVQESELLEVDQIVMGPVGFDGRRTVIMHPITARMMRTGEDRATATIGWTIDRAVERALRRHEARCRAADIRGNWRATWSLIDHEADVQRMRSRWRIAHLMEVPYDVLAEPAGVSTRQVGPPGVENTL